MELKALLEKLERYKQFHDHIKGHFENEHPDWEVECKICDKTISEIIQELSSGGSEMCPDCNVPMKKEIAHEVPSGGEVPAVSMGRCETVSKETKGELKPAEATKYRRVPSYYRNGIKIRGYIIKIKPKGKCVMCGDKGIFQIGSGQTATLNGRDCTKSIEAHYKKGEWLCEDCLFK